MARKASRITFDLTNDSLDEPMLKYRNRGFTIVELLIVIVVITILAAITAVAYSGIQKRARASAAQSAARQAASSIASYAVQNADCYPATAAAAGLNDSASTTYQYRVDNTASPRSFCVTATSNNVSYYSSSTSSSPTVGACAGHGANGSLTTNNLVMNPALRADLSGWGVWTAGATGTSSRPSSGGPSNAASFYRLTLNSSPTQSPASIGPDLTIPVGANAYCASMYLRASSRFTGTLRLDLNIRNSSGVSVASASSTGVPTAAGQWTRVSHCFTTPAGSSSIAVSGIFSGPQSAPTGTTLDATDAMLSDGPNLFSYGNGDTPGWAWNGTPNNSTSSGPAL